uniref:NADH-ubiquinone oxidoreductase chain 3 n=1 Tax=Steinernema litorale TaxID=361181 RepID=A0A1E1G7G2_9BILA|nr:NADH dehydrogenase subunit 3 [Steinernema litorale]
MLFIFVLLLVLMISIILLVVFYLINFLLSLKSSSKNKISAFESGFVSVGKIQNSFSIHFFIIMLMFIIFDLEVVLFIGVLISDLSSVLSFFMLLTFVLGGFYMEWWYGKLSWII